MALLFEKVQGYDIPVLINMFGSHDRMSWALGVDTNATATVATARAHPRIRIGRGGTAARQAMQRPYLSLWER